MNDIKAIALMSQILPPKYVFWSPYILSELVSPTSKKIAFRPEMTFLPEMAFWQKLLFGRKCFLAKNNYAHFQLKIQSVPALILT